MNRLEQYVDSIVNGLQISKEEQLEIRQEMLDHLTDHIDELMIKGYGKDEAISMAIASFGQQKKIRKEMNKVLFPYAKIVRFIFSILSVAALLCFTSHLLTKWYEPMHDSPVTWGVYGLVLVICFFYLGVAEIMFITVSKEHPYKWLTNPWVFFLGMAFLLEMICYFAFAVENNANELWIYNDVLFIPIYIVYYVISRQIFTLLFVARGKKREIPKVM